MLAALRSPQGGQGGGWVIAIISIGTDDRVALQAEVTWTGHQTSDTPASPMPSKWPASVSGCAPPPSPLLRWPLLPNTSPC